MKRNPNVIRPKYLHTPSTSSTLQVINKTKMGNKINIKVRLVSNSFSLSNSVKNPKFTPTTSYSSYDDSRNSSIKPSLSINSPVFVKPDDFIEPATNLSIPSTEEYMKHRHLSEPIPEISGNKSSFVNNDNKKQLKLGITVKSVVSSSVQKKKSNDFKKINNVPCKNLVKNSPSIRNTPRKFVLKSIITELK